jgi:hypothetical protein
MADVYLAVRKDDYTHYDTYEECETAAKRASADQDYGSKEFYVLKAVSLVKQPVPEAEVVKL